MPARCGGWAACGGSDWTLWGVGHDEGMQHGAVSILATGSWTVLQGV